jgi:tRNA pseudouridine38-40 synthase
MKNLRNLKVTMSFNGTAYHGFQRQANAVTVQELVEAALSKLLKEESAVTGCSRTDTGVHAREFCFNTRTTSTIPNDGFVKGMNALLPNDIAVHSCVEVDESFHARYSAKSKEYSYLIRNGKVRDVFMRDLAHFYPYSLNTEAMNHAANLFIGEHDFSAYCKAESLEAVKSKKHGAVREVYDFRVIGRGNIDTPTYAEIIIHGNGFLHNMVRIMSGTLIYVSEGKRSLDDVRESLLTGNREKAGITLPPQGLYLNKVIY